jgi:hypothetical protein
MKKKELLQQQAERDKRWQDEDVVIRQIRSTEGRPGTYKDEFESIVAWAKERYKSLHSVHEVDQKDMNKEWLLQNVPHHWTCAISDQDWKTDPTDYGSPGGMASPFFDNHGQLRTVVRVVSNKDTRPPEATINFDNGPRKLHIHGQYKYVCRIPTLLHEIGHVEDYENKINFDLASGKIDHFQGELYAHKFALTECGRRNLQFSAQIYRQLLQAWSGCEGEVGEAAKKALEF